MAILQMRDSGKANEVIPLVVYRLIPKSIHSPRNLLSLHCEVTNLPVGNTPLPAAG